MKSYLPLLIILLSLLSWSFLPLEMEEPPYNAQGEIAGEVTDSSVIIHTRTTLKPERNPTTKWWAWDDPFEALPYSQDLPEEVPGREGRVRILYSSDPKMDVIQKTPWKNAVAENDFNVQFEIDQLQPDTRYYYRAEITNIEKKGASRLGAVRSFKTAPEAHSFVPLNIVVTTCGAARSRDIYENGVPVGHQSYRAMASIDPDFFVHLGDIVYYDSDSPLATHESLARFHWHRMLSIPTFREVLDSTAAFFIKDDHDYRWNDAWPQQEIPHINRGTEYYISDEMGRRLFLEAVPMGEKTYRTRSWGKHLQVWFVEGRDYRDPNDMPDGPDKSLWGEEQKAWLKNGLVNSSATFKVVFSPTPIIGPDRDNKIDNHANPRGFWTEGKEFLRWVGESDVKNLYIVNGDRHWQYHSIDENGVEEFSVGAVSDEHAAVNQPRLDEEHQPFFREGQGGFLHIRLTGTEEHPELHMIFRDVDGSPLYVERKLFE